MPESTARTVETGAYEGATFALLTQHGKEAVLAPLFAETWGARVVLADGFDTDSLGTFTRDVPRDGTQLEAARKKARIGMDRSGLSLGLASEGAFVPGPFGLYAMNLELVILLDASWGIEIVGRAQAPGRHVHALVRTRDELEDAARRCGFPEHGLVLRPNDDSDPRVQKGLRAWDALVMAFARAQAESSRGGVFVENDLRAHQNPTRMATITAAARDLVARMSTRCPACDTPGFGVAERLPGLPCSDCGSASRQARAEKLACVACEHRQERDLPVRFADPVHCEYCNP